MKLVFAGTRGEIEVRTPAHRMHSTLLVKYRGLRVMVDCGSDWLGRLETLRPAAAVVTHAHPDRARGLKEGAPCPVSATERAWEEMSAYGIRTGLRHTVTPRERFTIGGMVFEAFPLEHSTRCPAVGYRVTAGRVSVFYAPDVMYIHGRADPLRGISLYSGDGSTAARPMVRKMGENLIGHASMRTRLSWCGKEGVPTAVFTHCGSQVVGEKNRDIESKVRRWGAERGVRACVARDGMEMVLR